MTDYDPGAGWVQAAAESRGVEEGRDVLMRVRNGVKTYWVREEPAPTLPTEDFTVIRMTPPDGSPSALYVRDEGRFWMVTHTAWLDSVSPRCAIDVLAEPLNEPGVDEDRARVRRETATAVLQRVRDDTEARMEWLDHDMLNELAGEFGVEL